MKNLLASKDIEDIFENSDFIYMLSQASGDREILAEKLNISPKQAAYVTQSGPGEGIILFGNVILPFLDKFPKETTLYGAIAEPTRAYAATPAQTSRMKAISDRNESQHKATYNKMKETLDELDKGIVAVFESGKYEKYLNTLSKFHNYSYANCLLIAMQKPEATHVAGETFWREEMRRFIKGDEKGIKINAINDTKKI